MSQIKIDLDAVEQLNGHLNRTIDKLSNLTSNVTSLGKHVDSEIASRRNIRSRLYNSSRDLYELEMKARELQAFIANSVDRYNKAESDLAKQASLLSDNGINWSMMPDNMKSQVMSSVQQSEARNANPYPDIPGIDWSMMPDNMKQQVMNSIQQSEAQKNNAPKLTAYDPNTTVSVEELISGKSDRYTPDQLRAMWDKLSPGDKNALSKLKSENWFQNGPVRSTLFNNVIKPFANGVDTFSTTTPLGQFIDRASQTAAGVNPEDKTSTGNATADKFANFTGNVMGMFTPIMGSGMANVNFTGVYTAGKSIIPGAGKVAGNVEEKVVQVTGNLFEKGTNVLKNFNLDDAFVKTKHLSTTKGNGAKFVGDSKAESEVILKDAMKNGKVTDVLDNGVTQQGNQSYEIIIDAGKTVGTKGETSVKIILSEDGAMLSAYPIK